MLGGRNRQLSGRLDSMSSIGSVSERSHTCNCATHTPRLLEQPRDIPDDMPLVARPAYAVHVSKHINSGMAEPGILRVTCRQAGCCHHWCRYCRHHVKSIR